jgi:hypothetical protein
MKSYIAVTGIAFGLIVLAHIARLFDEGAHLLGEPIFLVTSLGSLAMCLWAAILFKRASAS